MPLAALALMNPNQRKAVEHVNGPLLVLAGAGSGKTRVLTYRIANLIESHGVDPAQIFAVTFTNKAAGEMKHRIQALFCQQRAMNLRDMPFDELLRSEQNKIQRWVTKEVIAPLWVGTFHALCGRLLRSGIEKYTDWSGRSWKSNFNIADEGDVQSIIKQIIIQDLNLDEQRYQPRPIRFEISRAKNQGLTPTDFLKQEGANFRNQRVADIYERYQARLAENNTLDFDDLIWIPTRLFAQHPDTLAYWHKRFTHVLVDEYQDTNRTQYQLIEQLVTGGVDHAHMDWSNRSVFVVGDADQSIYSFRCADFRIIMEFQETLGNADSLVKLEENYRSTPEILATANHLINRNQERFDKVLRPTRDSGHKVHCQRTEDEEEEGRFIVQNIIQQHTQENRRWKDFAILYRTNSQSRAIEDQLRQQQIPYTVIGGLKFYDRKEIKDILSYLKFIHNPDDSLSLRRAISVPKRGIGPKTLETVSLLAMQQGVGLWQAMNDHERVRLNLNRGAKQLEQFVTQVNDWQNYAQNANALEVLDKVLEESGYVLALREENTQEADNRLENILELRSGVQGFLEKNDEMSLAAYLAVVSLYSDLDDLDSEKNQVSLMTIHASKGLEYPVVFVAGWEQGLFPHERSMDDASAIEEERRLAYVAITRAQTRLFLSYTQQRRLWGETKPVIPSQFLYELPPDQISGILPKRHSKSKAAGTQTEEATSLIRVQAEDLAVGDTVIHKTFGSGQVTHMLAGNIQMSVAVNFPGLGRKILNPKQTPLFRLPN
jgi:DNA helicase II / ATP-dependent DNA helicase PcrA